MRFIVYCDPRILAPPHLKKRNGCRLPEPVGGHRDAGSAARHSGREHKHGASSAERWGVISAPLRGGAECTFALVIEIGVGES